MSNYEETKILAAKGLTTDEIIEKLGISKRTLQRYRKKDTELSKQITMNDNNVGNLIKTAYKVAFGYTMKKDKIIKDDAGTRVVTLCEEVAPSNDMIKYLLNNRDRLNFSNNPNKDRIDNELLELKKNESIF